MLAATAGASQPVLAGLLGLGAAGLAGAVVAMAWSVHARQIRLAELLARRQFILTREPAAPEQPVNGHAGADAAPVQVQEALEEVGAREAQAGQKAQGTQGSRTGRGGGGHVGNGGRGAAPARPGKLAIEGPETVVVGEQVRYRVRPSAVGTAVTWAAGGGSVSQAPDPTHPDELLLIADRPGSLMLHVRVREGLAERRETKSVTAVPDVTPAASPFPLRLFLHGWGLVVVAILVVGFAGALDALGNLTSGDFIALVVPLTALLGVLAAVRGAGDPAPNRNPAQRSGHDESPAWPEP
ncbi:MAG TPA: hypothetical protein VK280_20125 [Streptosporangiaceae bacterium]|nr:hypothetical protein [Streptosporangiaceae bacterium]